MHLGRVRNAITPDYYIHHVHLPRPGCPLGHVKKGPALAPEALARSPDAVSDPTHETNIVDVCTRSLRVSCSIADVLAYGKVEHKTNQAEQK
jgi:hypothetical protein